MSFEIAKAGWLFRESSVLRRWKKNWFVLYQDGTLRYFETPESHVSEEAVRMQIECLSIKVGQQVTDVAPPPGLNRDCLMTIALRNKSWNICAESADDMSAWHISLEQARLIQSGHPPASRSAPPAAPPPYSAAAYPQQGVAYGYPGQVVYGSQPPNYVVQAPPGQTTVIYADQPRYYRRGYDGTDVAMGVMAGAAIGSMMYMPMMFW